MPIDWNKTIVDAAQVVSAIATAASVIVALWLARRSESQRLKFYIDERRVITIEPEGQSAREVIATHLKLTIVNAGVLPSHVQYVLFTMPSVIEPSWRMVLQPDSQEQLSKTLNHGEYMSYTLALPVEHFPAGSKLNWWWRLRRVNFDVHTSLGVTPVRLKRRDIRWIRRAVIFARNSDNHE